ncbi:MAG: c-type cytochrome biogenesis protein CcmI [Pseudomonadota bacterium]|jgi:cytochrome c-type biogenesis protein CcmH
MLWIFFAVMLLAAVAVLVLPLLITRPEAAARIDYDVVVYREQLAEIDQEMEEGLLDAEQAKAARAEIHRRMLAAEDAEPRVPSAPTSAAHGLRRHWRLAALLVLVPALGALALYAQLGSPELADKKPPPPAQSAESLAMEAQAAQMEAALVKAPTIEGYQSLARVYSMAKDYPKAAASGRKAIDLGAKDAATWSEMGEALVMGNDGQVVPEALDAFVHALSIEPNSERAKFYIGLAEAQIGQYRRAVAIWKELDQSSPKDAPWAPMVKEHIEAFSKEGGFKPAEVAPEAPSPAALRASLNAMAGARR